jgi:hypothetical protein
MLQERDIPQKYRYLERADRGETALDRVGGAQLLFLYYPWDTFGIEQRSQILAPMTDDDNHFAETCFSGRFKNSKDHRPSEHRMHHLGQVRLHTSALSRGQDNGTRHGST